MTLQKDDAFIPHWFYLWLNSGVHGHAIFHTELKSPVKEELLHRNVIFSLRLTWLSQRNTGFYGRCCSKACYYTVDRHFLWFFDEKNEKRASVEQFNNQEMLLRCVPNEMWACPVPKWLNNQEKRWSEAVLRVKHGPVPY